MNKKSLKKKIGEAVEESVRKFTAEIEQRRIIFQSVLNENIDILLHNSENWFGRETPEEYKKVLHSLFALANSFMLEEYDYESKPGDTGKNRFELTELILDLFSDFKSTFKFGNYDLERDKNVKHEILAPREQVRKAFYNILISLYPFFRDSSLCEIKIRREYSNIITELSFNNLTDSFPGAVKMQRIFFPYITGKRYSIGIGIYSAITGLKDAGAQVYIPNLNETGNFKTTVSFPTIEFLNSLNEVRSQEILHDRRKSKSGEILISSSDFILEMVLTEFLTENGYSINRTDLSNIETLENPHFYKAFIIDIEHIVIKKMEIKEFIELSSGFKQNIIIYGSNDEISEELLNSGCMVMKKPIEVEEIIRILEGDGVS